MREIKFKVWLDGYGWTKQRMDFMHLPNAKVEPIKEKENGKLTWCQYTGLKDKNGVEIYEGDIVTVIDCEPNIYKIEFIDFRCSFEIVLAKSDCDNCWTHAKFDDDFDNTDIEVIGNIYENPELLEK